MAERERRLGQTATIGSTDLQAIQLLQLATHTSGLPDEAASQPSAQLFDDQALPRRTLDFWNSYAQTNAPGTCWCYSSFGFVTLGFALTMISNIGTVGQNGPSLADIITGPLKMPSTSASVTGTDVASGYIGHWNAEGNFGKNVPTKDTAYDLKSNGTDMLAFLQAQLDPTALDPNNSDLAAAILLSQTQQNDLKDCGSSDGSTVAMGLGWQIQSAVAPINGIYWKNGATSVGGFQSYVMIVPDLNIGISVLANQFVEGAPPADIVPAGVKPGALAYSILKILAAEKSTACPPPHPTSTWAQD